MSKPTICPTVTAYDLHGFRQELDNVKDFATRIHIDLMDGIFTETKSPELDKIWWYDNQIADIHLMYQNPMNEVETLIRLKPSLVIIQFEAEVDLAEFAKIMNENGINVGLSILQETTVGEILPFKELLDHILVFSGHLGYHGGEADLSLLDKVKQIKEQFADVEIGWDGGINDQNVKELIEAGVDVLNVGGYIQKSENPSSNFKKLTQII